MRSSSKHIAILCSYLHVPGGYEKAVVTLANLFVQKGNHVTLVILDNTKEIFYPLDPSVKVIQQPLSFGIGPEGNIISRKVRLLTDVVKLRKILNKIDADHIIATEYAFSVASVLSGAGRKAKLFLWEHHHFNTAIKNSFWSFLFLHTAKRLDAIICLNEDERKHYVLFNKNATVIPNFITPPENELPLYEQNKKTDILTVTRFNHIKGIDLFMVLAKKVLQQNPLLTWKVIGYGIQEKEFLEFIQQENLSRQLIFQPATDVDINTEYQQASLFVMTSRNECFPLVLLEAMNNGLPCIAFDCDTGPRHIIDQNKTGLLVEKENVDKMASTILAIMEDVQKRNEMNFNALIAIRQFYPDKVYEKWEKLFSNIPAQNATL